MIYFRASSLARLPVSLFDHVASAACAQSRRAASTSTPAKSRTAIYISNSTDPFLNLAYEEWLFRKTDPSIVTLYMYRNTPSVIIGRNQNPWKEIDLARLRQLGIPFVRRKSGGGTVYHDLGNTNYCVFVPRLQFERRPNAELVTRALNSLGAPAYVNERHDICIDGYKISGSAFKIVNARAYHHGTMLLDAKLSNLRGVLGPARDRLVTKGVASVPSPVRNVAEWKQGISHDAFVDAVVREFVATYDERSHVEPHHVSRHDMTGNEYVRQVRDELLSWEWMYGQTPEFTHEIEGELPAGKLTCTIQSRHAIIDEARLTDHTMAAEWSKSVEAVLEASRGDRYETMDKTKEQIETCADMKERERQLAIFHWLTSAM